MAGVIWSAALAQPDGKVHIWIIGAKGDFSSIIRSAQGQTAVINPKSDPRFLEVLGKKLPFFDRNLALVVLTRSGDSSRSALEALTKRYRLTEVWSPTTYSTDSKDIKLLQSSGWTERERLGLKWQTWQVPNEEGLIRLSSNLVSLFLVGKSKSDVWSSWPSDLTSSLLVGPPVKDSIWSGTPLLAKFKPELVITDADPALTEYRIAGEVEIVWDRDSWYINPNP